MCLEDKCVTTHCEKFSIKTTCVYPPNFYGIAQDLAEICACAPYANSLSPISRVSFKTKYSQVWHGYKTWHTLSECQNDAIYVFTFVA